MAKEHSCETNDGRVNGMYLDDRLPQPASAIKLARRYELPGVLAAAYYALYTIPGLRYDFSASREGGVHTHLQRGGRTARFDQLDMLDMRCLIELQEMLISLSSELKHNSLDLGSPGHKCSQPEKC